ncbi:aegerolysin family protein [Kitasatospora sp. McL0602]|uniref:aegerolysin family protein n=1 Tax=Kitasatospora sp. McL0602 TaxID=3439530 RepID=UPI003F8C21C9
MKKYQTALRRTARVLLTGALTVSAAALATAPSYAEQPARSVDLTLTNSTACTLRLDSVSVDHGQWTSAGQPSLQVDRGGTTSLRTESNGFMTGTEGHARYHAESCADGVLNDAVLSIHWDNPYAGSNSYDANGSNPGFAVSISGGGGTNAAVTFTIGSAGLPTRPGHGPVHGGVSYLQAANGMVADLDGGRVSPGTTIKAQPPNWGEAEQWVFWDKGNGNWQIETQYRGGLLMDYNFTNWTTWLVGANGGNNQLWQFQDAGNGWYQIKSARDGGCLTANQNQQALGVWSCSGADSQKWHLV